MADSNTPTRLCPASRAALTRNWFGPTWTLRPPPAGRSRCACWCHNQRRRCALTRPGAPYLCWDRAVNGPVLFLGLAAGWLAATRRRAAGGVLGGAPAAKDGTNGLDASKDRRKLWRPTTAAPVRSCRPPPRRLG